MEEVVGSIPTRSTKSLSRLDLNRRPVRHRLPDFIDLFVRDRDAPVRPILETVGLSHPAVALRQAMYEHISPWGDSLLARLSPVVSVGIRDVDRLVKLAMRVSRIENVKPFGGRVITLPRLRPEGISTQGNPIRPDYFPLAEELQRALFLEDHNAVSVQWFGRCLRQTQSGQCQHRKASENPDAHAPDYSGAIPRSATLLR